MKTLISLALTTFALGMAQIAHAGVEGSISGTITDNQGVAVSSAPVQLKSQDGSKVIKEATSSTTGEYQFFPVPFGDYLVTVQVTRLRSLINPSCT